MTLVNKHTLDCIYTNADSLLNKRTELLTIIAQHAPDVLMITEFAPKNTQLPVQEIELQIEGYDLFSNIEKHKRGVLIYTKKNLQASPSTTDSTYDFEESCWCEISLQREERLLVGCVYRSPNSDLVNNTKLISGLKKVCDGTNFTHLLICGDFNLPEINWIDETTPANPNHQASVFMECLRDCFLFQHVKLPTHQRAGQQANILDLILTNEEDMIDKIQHNAPLGKSAHATLVFKFKYHNKNQAPKRKKYKYDKGDYCSMKENMKEYNWEEDLESLTCEESWNIFSTRLKKEMDTFIPKTSSKTSRLGRPLWMTTKALQKVKKKNQSYKRYLETREGRDYLEYAKARNQAKGACRSAVKDFEKKIAREARDNPKAFFSYAKSKLKTRSSVPDLIKPDGAIASKDRDKAELLNNFFSSVFTHEDLTNIPDFEKRNINHPSEDLYITPDKVKKKLRKLKPNKSPGPDGIHPRVLVELVDELAEPLAIIMNKSLEEGVLPQAWKEAQVSPIFKKGSKSEPGNYRPVSLTSVICKVTESIIRDHVMEHLYRNELLTTCQHGFVEGRSCTTQLLECLDIWTSILDNGGQVDVLYLDFAKAFDKVAHQRLIKKLEGYGINKATTRWIQNFLSERKQKVVVNGEESSWADVISGVPQGSVLGPMLFVCYINDLPDVIHTMVRMFADDTKIFTDVSDTDNQEELQKDIERLDEWASEWQLTFNATKCKVMHLGNKNPQQTYKMKKDGIDVTLDTTTLEKDLGVHVDNQLKFDQHTEKQVNKANKILGLIRRSYTFLDRDSTVTLYTSLIRPHLEYGHAVTYPRHEKECKLIEGVQRRATKMIPELRNMSYQERLAATGLPSMYFRRDRGDMIETYKYVHKIYRSKPLVHIRTPSTLRGHSLKLTKHHSSKTVRHHFFAERVINNWNALPEAVVTAPSLNSFKNRLDIHWNNYKHYLHPLPATP